MAGGYGPLDFVNEAGGCVNSVMFGSGPILGHGEEVVLFDIDVDALGDDFLEEFASIFEEGDWAVGLGDCVVRFLWLVYHDYGGGFPGVVP
jgi:hypothetical protein